MFKKYPFVRQDNLKDCGAASIAMIVQYYGGYITKRSLNEKLKTNLEGTTAYHMILTLEELGFKAQGMKLKTLTKTEIPFIANVIIENSYKHFLVVYKVNDQYVLVADPASGIKKMTLAEFYQIWTGVNILMYPIKPILREQKISCFKFIIKLIIPHKLKFIKLFFLSLGLTFISLMGSFMFQSLIDHQQIAKQWFSIFALIFTLKILIDYGRNKALIKLSCILDYQLTAGAFQDLLTLPYEYYHNHTSGEIISKINDLAVVRDMISKVALSLFIDLPLSIFSALLLWHLSHQLFIIVLIVLILYILILLIFRKKLTKSIKTAQTRKAEVNSYMVECIKGFETVKGLCIADKMQKLFTIHYRKLLESNYKLSQLTNRQFLAKNFVNMVGQLGIMFGGIILVNQGLLSLGTLITYNVLVSLFLDPIRNIIDLDFEIKEALSALRRVLALFEGKHEKWGQALTGKIEFKNLNFSFDNVNYILKNVNLTIEEGTKVLITGPSGSGKSTLVKILKGYYPEYTGQLLMAGKPLKNISPRIIYMSPKEILFTGTINYNLTLKGSKNLALIKKICQTEQIVSQNSLGYNQLLEEDGFNISGGQRQRIALARALHDFDTLIIDEGLSGLETNLERQIIKDLFKHYAHKTIIVISHRLDNLDLFDQYVRLENGIITLDEKRAN